MLFICITHIQLKGPVSWMIRKHLDKTVVKSGHKRIMACPTLYSVAGSGGDNSDGGRLNPCWVKSHTDIGSQEVNNNQCYG